ncbi:hypothetical protein SAMN04487820_112109 [Actinopolyspora mzabensis]|uniref:Excreted virulence factor EspC, type VII ESX diderm n=1 Tax=Actinopolyspora mzabensis TaxID=995066 RepID=A0A1G9EKB7_ACTMZ|nr:hypothetical protein [Actinopolyspora mzabensis]SDK76637.1 hypothetical protein SAMN04487820_112109 [Actinopolyspora mzabensis]
MNAGFRADPVILDEIIGTLRQAGDELHRTRAAAPAEPDAGDASAAVATLLNQLVEEADRLSATASATGDAVADSAAAYIESDRRAREGLPALRGQ